MTCFNTSGDALRQARSALECFALEIEGMASRASVYSQDTERECANAIAATSDDIEKLTRQINDLRTQIEKAKETIAQDDTRISELQQDNRRQRENLDYLSGRLTMLKQELARLRQQPSQTDDDRQEKIQQQTYQVESKISQCEVSRRQIETRINENKQEITAKKSERSAAESNRMRWEEEESEARRIRNQYESKFERLKTDAAKIKSDMDAYSQLSRVYERSAVGDSEAYRGSLDECIALVEEYENASL